MGDKTLKRILLAGFLAVLLSAPAFPGVSVTLRSGNSASGTLDPATEIEAYTIDVPAGALLKLKAKGSKKGPAVAVEIRDSLDAVVGAALLREKGTAVSGKNIPLELGGRYTIRVTSRDGATPGDYSMKVSWKSPKKFPGDPNAADTGGTIQFRADAEAVVAASVAPGKGSVVVPRILRIRGPNAFLVDFTTLAKGAKVKKIELPFTGEYELDYADDSNTGGVVKAAVVVKQPKPSSAKINVTNDAIGGAGGIAAAVAEIIPADGGVIEITPAGPNDPLNDILGTTINIPSGALPTSTPIVVGTSSDVPTGKVKGNKDSSFDAKGPSVFFGPEGLKFKEPVSITIPADTSGDTSSTVVLTKSANGKVEKITEGVTVGAGSVTFPTSHFSSFQAFQETVFVEPGDGIGPITGTLEHFVTGQLASLSGVIASGPSGFRGGTGPTAVALTRGGDFSRSILLSVSGEPGAPVTSQLAGNGSNSPPTVSDGLRFTSVSAIVLNSPGDVIFYADRDRVFQIQPVDPFNVSALIGNGEFVEEFDDLFDPSLGDGGPLLDAQFYDIRGLATLTTGELVVADQRRLRISRLGNIEEFAGDPALTLNEPPPEITDEANDGIALSDMAFNEIRTIEAGPNGSVFVAERGRIRQIAEDGGNGLNITIAGPEDNSQGPGNFDNDGADLEDTEFSVISGMAYDATRNILFVCDSDITVVWALDLDGGICRLVAGSTQNNTVPLDGAALPASLDNARDVALLGSDLLVTGSTNTIYRLTLTIPAGGGDEEPSAK